jgi:hypothetical protein
MPQQKQIGLIFLHTVNFNHLSTSETNISHNSGPYHSIPFGYHLYTDILAKEYVFIR